MRWHCLLALLFFLSRPVLAEDTASLVFFSPIHGKQLHLIPIINSTGVRISDINVHVDCGCIKIEQSPAFLDLGQTQNIEFSVYHPIQAQRKVNILMIDGKPDFHESIRIVNYFYSEVPQIFGDTIIHIRELPPLASLMTAVIIGGSNITTLNVTSDERLGIRYDLSNAVEFKDQNGCFKRILKIYLDPVRLLQEKKEMVYARVAANGKQVSISAE